MKKNTGIFLALGAAAIAFFYFQRFKKIKNIKAIIRGINFGGSILKPKIFIKLGIQNATSNAGTINSIVGNLYAQNKLIANISSFERVRIEPNAETVIQITAEPALTGIVQNVISSLKDKFTGVKIKFDGSINVEGNNLPISANYTA